MTEIDEIAFVEEVKAKLDAVIVPTFFKTEQPPEFQVLPTIEENDGGVYLLAIYNRSICPKLKVRFISKTGKHSLEEDESEVIQFVRSRTYADGTLEVGRLWYEPKTIRGKSKRKEFVTWAEAVFRYIKTNFHYNKERLNYIGPDALQKLGEGQLVLGW
jgi:apolipoprotein N-acyltransferase